MIRDDLSDRLIHLTRGETTEHAAQVFMSILEQRKLIGGSGDIRGGFRCVCFSEAPVSKLAHILAQPMAHGMRYSPFGVMLSKTWVFAQGGRPAIYQAGDEFELLCEEQRYRHVRYEPLRGIDFTWEREWRVRTDELALDPDEVTLVVPSRAWERWAQKKHIGMLSRRAMLMSGMIGPASVSDFPWHFVVLEDLGVDLDPVDPPPP